jgi:hypothetical protein
VTSWPWSARSTRTTLTTPVPSWPGTTGYDHVIDEGGRLAIDFGVTGPPESYFVDADGIVRAKQFGPLNEMLMDERLAAIGMNR